MYSFRPPVRRRITVEFTKPSLTKQSEKDACDVNRIMAKYKSSGVLDHVASATSRNFLDVSEVVDYQTALNTVQRAEDAFFSLPAKVRSRFHNDPHQLLVFLRDSSNRDEARKLGLLQGELPLRGGSDLKSVPSSPSTVGSTVDVSAGAKE